MHRGAEQWKGVVLRRRDDNVHRTGMDEPSGAKQGNGFAGHNIEKQWQHREKQGKVMRRHCTESNAADRI